MTQITGEERCEGNIRYLFRKYNLEQLKLIKSERDRCSFEYSDKFWQQMKVLWNLKQFNIWNHFTKEHGRDVSCGFREFVPRFSLQVLFHNMESIECDIDLYNPDYGLLYLVAHGIECAWLGKTDPFKVYNGLMLRKT
jgi:hypothetical protein